MDKKGKYAIIGGIAVAMCMSCCCCSSLIFIGKNSEPEESTKTSESSTVETTENTEASAIEETTSIVTTIATTTTSTTTYEATTALTEATTFVTTEAEETNVSPETVITLIKMALADTPDNVKTEVSYSEENNMYTIKVQTEGTAALATMATNGVKVDDWNSVVESMKNLCQSIYDLVKELDPSANVTVMVLNDANTDNALIGVLNGIVMFDYGKGE